MTWRRLIAAGVAREWKPKLEEVFREADQFGVAVAGGKEKVAMRAQLVHQNGHWVIQTDCSNAFNTAKRMAIMAQAAKSTPDLVGYIARCYDEVTAKAIFKMDSGERRTIECKSGVQQGGGMGPPLFCFVLVPIVIKLNQKYEPLGVSLTAYMDGISLHFKKITATTIPVIQDLLDELQAAGIVVNRGESSALPPPRHEVTHEERRLLGEARLPVAEEGITVLSIPIGTDDFVKGFAEEVITKGRAGKLARGKCERLGVSRKAYMDDISLHFKKITAETIQDGTDTGDYVKAAAAGLDGSIFVAGYTYGDWSEAVSGKGDFAVTKLDGREVSELGLEGRELWKYQNGTGLDDRVNAAALGHDGSIVLAGYAGERFTVFKLATNDGRMLFEWKGGAGVGGEDVAQGIAVAGDGSMVVVGHTRGEWNTTYQGAEDFAAFRLDTGGEVLWKFQDGTPETDELRAVTAVADGTIVLAGSTKGIWTGSNSGSDDFAAARLNASTGYLFSKWQGGSSGDDDMEAIAAGAGGAVVLAGYADEAWDEASVDYNDFLAVALDPGFFTPEISAPTARARGNVSVLSSLPFVSFDAVEGAEGDLIQGVREAVGRLLGIIQTYQSKNKLAQVLISTLLKRRLEEADKAIDRAINRYSILQIPGQSPPKCNDTPSILEYGQEMKEAEHVSNHHDVSLSARRRRRLERLEIPEGDVSISSEMLGQGGFGKVYIADYVGGNAAAKVLEIDHGLTGLEGTDDDDEPASRQIGGAERERRQRRAFLRELQAMLRLRSPHCVQVYGVMTSSPDRLVIVMELLVGGDLRMLLKRRRRQRLPDEQCRRIIGDVCAGMEFLHSKETVHGDLKSPNVLLDGAGRVKIGDFGASRWTQHTNSNNLATYTSRGGRSARMTLAWSAPEALDGGKITYASDVYSFGVLAWEAVTTELPWANATCARDIMCPVINGTRPTFPGDAPAGVADVAKACWAAEPDDRPSFKRVMKGLRSNGWSE
eukprot:g17232.t1